MRGREGLTNRDLSPLDRMLVRVAVKADMSVLVVWVWVGLG